MTTRLLMAVLAAVALAACGVHSEADHEHGDGGHAHGATEAESWAVTAWGEHFGLFPEVDALVAGETANAHVHVTILDGFKPATEGSVAIVLRNAVGEQERFSSTIAIRPGIFNVAMQPASAGELELHFEIEVGGMAETIPGGRVRVGTEADPGGLVAEPHALPEVAGDEEVGFLLEQQWRTAFATAWAEPGALKPGLRATAQVLLPGEVEGILLPDSAVVDDAGVPVVYIQLDGETFSRRLVAVQRRQGDLVLVDGVLPGERVVTVGGASIRRASLLASGSVEGHVH